MKYTKQELDIILRNGYEILELEQRKLEIERQIYELKKQIHEVKEGAKWNTQQMK